jgi:hypothetical protein
MTSNRKCQKCGDSLTLNEKLELMECVSGIHVEPINLVRAQWWNKCPKCKQIGLNDIDGEKILQKFEIVEEKVNGKLQLVKKPVTKKVGDKKSMIVFEENQVQTPVTCKACGNTFTKKSALN